MGHAIFIEDAIETSNVYDGNLIVHIKESNSLLNTDSTPGGFWITHPNNKVTNNAVAGSKAYCFWYDLMDHPIGPSRTTKVCPIHEKLGEFSDNVGHGCKYGLRIHHGHTPY